MLKRYLKKQRSLSSPYLILVEWIVVSCDVVSNSSDDGPMYTYYLVYEFYINGEKNIYRSKYGYGRDKTDWKQMLYYNTQTKMTFEYNNLKKDILVAIISLFLGLSMFIILIL